jgi:hypothetical protein
MDENPETFSRRLAGIVHPHRGVLVVIDDSDDPGVAAAVDVAAALATEASVPVILYDRSDENWYDTPHPVGPLPIDDERLSGRLHVTGRMRRLNGAGVQTLAWVATLPSISGVATALRETGADVVVLPESMRLRLLERIKADSAAEMVRETVVTDLDLEGTVIEVADDGSVRVLDAH